MFVQVNNVRRKLVSHAQDLQCIPEMSSLTQMVHDWCVDEHEARAGSTIAAVQSAPTTPRASSVKFHPRPVQHTSQQTVHPLLGINDQDLISVSRPRPAALPASR